MEAHIARMTQSKPIRRPLSLPARSRTNPHRVPQQKPPRAKHGESLDIAELCRRLDALQRQDPSYGLDLQLPEKNRPKVSSGPYHHVPHNAAKGFARTTVSKTKRGKAGAFLSQSLPVPGNTSQGIKQRGLYRHPKLSTPRLARASPKLKQRHSLLPNHALGKTREATDPRRHQRLNNDGSQQVHDKDPLQGHRRNPYNALIERRGKIRRSSTGEMENNPLMDFASEFQPGSHALAHKITRQHLKNRADWTQSDACDDDVKQSERIIPSFRSVEKKGDLECDPDAEDLLLADEERQEVSRRRSSFITRYFVKKTQE